MSRDKTYYSADEIFNNLYTTGKEYMTQDGVEYTGQYHKYTTGEVYTLAKWNEAKSKKLIVFEEFSNDKFLYKSLKPGKNLKFTAPKSTYISINQNDINIGYKIRYFLQKRNSKVILEIDTDQYNKWKTKQIDNILYSAVKITWRITGEKSDKFEKGVSITGVKSKNLREIKNANKKMPGITKLLSNPLQYYTDTDFITPTDINGLDS